MMTWMKTAPDGQQYNHLLSFFTARPNMLVECGIFREDNAGVHYFYSKGGTIRERYIYYTELGKRPLKRALTQLVNDDPE